MFKRIINYVTGTWLLFAGVSAFAVSRTPANGAEQVGMPVKLAFTTEGKIPENSGFVIFIGTDQQKVKNAFYRNHANVDVYELETNELELPDLKTATTYFWRIDLFNDQKEPLKTGPVWSFTTAKTAGDVFVLNTSADHDLLADGVGDTGFDGFIGKGAGESAERIEIKNGNIRLQSSNAIYDGDASPLGPLLYKDVEGDFKVTTHVSDYQDIAYNNGGLLIRAANREDAGEGEDWVSFDYFPIYEGLYIRMTDEHRRHEISSNGQGRSADRWLQIEKIGNLFYYRHSADGKDWVEMPGSPVERNDLINIPLQVGVFHATYSGNSGYVAYDTFKLELSGHIKTARVHSPEDGSKDVPASHHLVWIPGSGAEFHDIYLGTSREAVEADQVGSGTYRGRQPVNQTTFDYTGLEDGVTYFWRIDEVSGDTITKGEIWSFTAFNRTLDDFAGYGSNAELAKAWKGSGNGNAELSKIADKKAVVIAYENRTSPHCTQLKHTFDPKQDWLSSIHGFRSLEITFKGDPANGADRLFMLFKDDEWGSRTAVVPYAGDLKNDAWTVWKIDLQELVRNNPAFRLDQVQEMAICVGNPVHPSKGGAGTLAVSSIRIDYLDESANWSNYVDESRFLDPVPFTSVHINDGLWRERMDVNRESSLPHVWDRCEHSTSGDGSPSLRLDNFRVAAGEKSGKFTGIFFNDSDVYKIIEGTAYSLQNHPDPELEAYTDKVIDSIAAAQWDDGYLFTFYSLPEHRPHERWTNVGGQHELYCAGHLIEAGIAYYETTGKRKLLDVAIRFADLICDTFGPGKRSNPPGHQEVEMALVRLAESTGDSKYLNTAKFFVDARGHSVDGRHLYGTYSQDHIPFVEQEEGVGHSVRAGYMYCAATDIVRLSKDEDYANALMRLWHNIVNMKTYITGGIGQPGGPEGFAGNYELGNNCYAETCSGIAFSMWNRRLYNLSGEGKYMDLVERTLLNNMLSSLSQDGEKHYYTNPLSNDNHRRWEWPGHDCACCPANLVRVISSIGGYGYSTKDKSITVDMYMPGTASIELGENTVQIAQITEYPWNGDIKLVFKPEQEKAFTVKLRIPGWALNTPMPGNLYKYLDEQTEPVVLKVNGSDVPVDVAEGYVALNRTWKAGDTIELSLPMRVRRVICHPNAAMNNGFVAIERGPFVYCAESADNSFQVGKLAMPDDVTFKTKFDEDFFSGAVTLEASNGVKLIPYFLHSNREKTEWMRVWMKRNP